MTNGDLSALVANDIASFVWEKKISGRVFLRLNEGDLEEYGINHLWCTTLLTSSRNLRSNALQDRIWGFGNSPQGNSPQEPLPSTRQRTLSNASDTSDSSDISPSSASSFTDHGRNATSNGKVRGIVASFERSSSIDEGSHSRSVSPNKRISTSRAASPTQARCRPGNAISLSHTGVLPSYTGRRVVSEEWHS
ncbi:hypothetical protein BDQ12DRAFT_716368 [Crucibulum laeve]|uniref:Uncharacterized protein n=1 Tax=Crucibulum laeve TaxID=68775 RepID=A0A5C3LII8_9AGAR|nr:hypothetical protein BDQ12DRAFT_716368 [Crucibulum laeve]